ncbi:MAG TPA: DUF559 domain-containing protein [Solirubrobacteraceae bacterium]|nr:DUF559 domain-containing protein [Solirubrobacteraceae bacterium]
MTDVGPSTPVRRGQKGPPPAELAAGQWGVVDRRQLLDGGLSSGAIDHWVATARLCRLHRGVYAFGHAQLGIEGRWMAAVLAAGPGAVLSHRDAAALWELLRPPRRALIDVTTPQRSRKRVAGIDLHRTRHLPASSVTMRRNIPVTTIARTLLDLADVAPLHHLRRAVDEARRRGWLNRRQLDQVLRSEAAGRRGARQLYGLLVRDRPVALTRSDLEERFLGLVEQAGLPAPLVNAKLLGRERDFVWPAQHLVVEVDSFEYHRTPERFEDDRARDRTLTVAGWRVARITDQALEREPHAVAADLRLLVKRAG